MTSLLVITSYINPFSTPTIDPRNRLERSDRFLQVAKIAFRTLCLGRLFFRSIRLLDKQVFSLSLIQNTLLQLTALKVLLIAVYASVFIINLLSIKNLFKDLLFWLATGKNPFISAGSLSLLFNTQSCDYKKRTLLHIAAMQRDSHTANYLLNHRADINAQDYQGNAPLHIALKNKNSLLISLLVESGADTSAQNYKGDTPLHIAAQLNLSYFFKSLINSSTNVPIMVNCQGHIPQEIAAIYDNPKFLYSLSYLNQLFPKRRGLKGNTLLHTAAKHFSLKSMDMLLSWGADPSAINNDRDTPLHLLFRAGTNWIPLDGNQSKKDLFLSIVKNFLKKGLNPKLSNKKGETPLNLAQKILSPNLKDQCLEAFSPYLKKPSPSVFFLTDETGSESYDDDSEDDVYIGLAWLERNARYQLLDSIDSRKTDSPSPHPHQLAKHNQDLSGRSDLDQKDHYGNTPLHIAVLHNSITSIESLLKMKSSLVNEKNAFGDTPLHLAVKQNKLSLAIKLIRQDANIDAQNKSGNTALHIAAKYHFRELIKFLIEKNADQTIQNNEEQTPEDLAERSLQSLITSLSQQAREASPPVYCKIAFAPSNLQ